MLTSGAILGLLAAAGGDRPAEPRSFHAVAFVNDPLSHGVVGDGLLSLNEAILLHNGQLAFSLLSAAEQLQLSLIPGTGTTTDVTWIDIDGTNTPLITIQQNLAPILDTSFGLLIKGFGDRPVFDFSGPGITSGMLVLANSMSVQNVLFLGGPYGMDVVQTDVSGQAGCTLQDVRFEGQATFGLRVSATVSNGAGRVILERCTFVNCPTAIVHDESGSGRTTIFEAHQIDITGAAVGCDVTLGAGGTTRYTFDRMTIAATVRGLRLLRAPSASRQAFLEGSFVRVRAPECVVLQCHPTGLTWSLLHLWDLRAPSGGTALQLGAVGDALFGELTEATLDGNVGIGCGGGPQPLTLYNLRCRNGTVSLARSATQLLSLAESRFDACAVTTAGTGTIAATDCCFVGGSLAGTAAAPLQLSNSFQQNVGAHVQIVQALPAAQLGSMSITPEDVAVGGSVQFVADLAPGLLAVFALGITNPVPVLLPPPLHLYFDPAGYVLLPGAYVLQQSYTWAVPNVPLYIGVDLVVQMAVLPGAGMQAPWLQLPPGCRFVLQ